MPTIYVLYHKPQDISHLLAEIKTALRIEIHKGGAQFFNSTGPHSAGFE